MKQKLPSITYFILNSSNFVIVLIFSNLELFSKEQIFLYAIMISLGIGHTALYELYVCMYVFTVRRDQVNLLVDRPDRPYFKQKQKNNITKFCPSDFFLNLLFFDF